ncbi:TadE/TadG family type IV pilus assembly protein [Ahrensia kielensis]|uniref:TadE/TadG family type IV pilus assembly protein n=1 Tax=Ahrensia kielensis TaxID=76980 RepID=UPI0003782DD0|nr:TadE/TadG family type IV pilus assembly protein [Ahrensia kielensis]
MTKAFKQNSLSSVLRKFRKDKGGIAAVEFALIVPLLLALYLGTVEISTGVTVNKRAARVASTVADLVTQQQEVDKKTLDSMLEIGAAIMYPYTADKPRITIVGVDVRDKHPDGGEIIWSRRYDKGKFDGGFGSGKGTKIAVPERLRMDGTFLIKVITEIEYRPIVTWVLGSKTDVGGNTYTALDMSEEYWLRPRIADTVTCTDC